MIDYTFTAYRAYIEALQQSGFQFITFHQFFTHSFDPNKPYCLLRHDVDRKVMNTCKMAELERELGVCSTYYFRTKKHVLKPAIIKHIEGMGHEIGYHYENLSDTKGDIEKGLEDFDRQLKMLRESAQVTTCAMHGRPLEPYDNRDLWSTDKRHALLQSRFELLGEVYVDIDYSDILFVTDSGRNWYSDKLNIRDKVESSAARDFENGETMLKYFAANPHPKIVFQIHPERWAYNARDYAYQWVFDMAVNIAKRLVKLLYVK